MDISDGALTKSIEEERADKEAARKAREEYLEQLSQFECNAVSSRITLVYRIERYMNVCIPTCKLQVAMLLLVMKFVIL